jgi:hypothetical protein
LPLFFRVFWCVCVFVCCGVVWCVCVGGFLDRQSPSYFGTSFRAPVLLLASISSTTNSTKVNFQCSYYPQVCTSTPCLTVPAWALVRHITHITLACPVSTGTYILQVQPGNFQVPLPLVPPGTATPGTFTLYRSPNLLPTAA